MIYVSYGLEWMKRFAQQEGTSPIARSKPERKLRSFDSYAVLGGVALNKEEKIRNRLLSERPAVQVLLDESIETFFNNPTQESFSEVCDALIRAVVYGMMCHVPVEYENKEMQYFMVRCSNSKFAYTFCNTGEELERCPCEVSIVMEIKTLLERVQNDNDGRIGGVVINPITIKRCICILIEIM